MDVVVTARSSSELVPGPGKAWNSAGRGLGHRHSLGAALLASAVLLLASPALAQRVTLGPEGVVQSENLGRAFETFSVFGGTPGIAAAYYYSKFQLNTFQLPITHAFEPIDGGGFANVAPYVELTPGYLTADQTFPLGPSPTTPGYLRATWHASAA
ncbi:MAG: hypothetical protein JOY63_15500, partial [Acetobacteraceae bacterium]|nr:hypothetical protein [Acetobacteraceae bacterium]